MNRLIVVKIFTLFLILSSTLFAQKKDKVEVSPSLTSKSIITKCKELDLGTSLFAQKPNYPKEAKSARIGGTVEVQILIGVEGNVIDIIGIKGHQLLQKAAKDAALRAKFTPTICDGKVAQVKALMYYNFIPFVITNSYFTPKTVEGFADITSDHEHYESIVFITENYKLAFGYGDNKFHSNAPLTKGDFAHFLRLTLDLLKERAELANKNPREIELFNSYNPEKIKNSDAIKDMKQKFPYAKSVNILVSEYDIGLIDNKKKFYGKYPLTYNEVINFWEKIFGKDAVPLHFNKNNTIDRIFTRGEFALFLRESLYVLTYKVLP